MITSSEFPPPYWILVPIDQSGIVPVRYGELSPTQRSLVYNDKYYTLEEFEDKAVWIARLLVLGIEYIEEVE